jgi:protein-S-isoprenylcysteine O-methyltransferase Ste14
VILQFVMAAILVAGSSVRAGRPGGCSSSSASSSPWWELLWRSRQARPRGSLTPFPHPISGAALVESGPYRVVRHPIYSGGTLFFIGISLALSPAALAITLVLAIVWALKAQVEESFLRTADPGYAAYCERTPARLVPFVY